MFGRKLRQLRESKGWSGEQLGNEAGLSRMFIWRLEAGTQAPSWSTVQALADAFGISTEEFRDEKKTRKKSV